MLFRVVLVLAHLQLHLHLHWHAHSSVLVPLATVRAPRDEAEGTFPDLSDHAVDRAPPLLAIPDPPYLTVVWPSPSSALVLEPGYEARTVQVGSTKRCTRLYHHHHLWVSLHPSLYIPADYPCPCPVYPRPCRVDIDVDNAEAEAEVDDRPIAEAMICRNRRSRIARL